MTASSYTPIPVPFFGQADALTKSMYQGQFINSTKTISSVPLLGDKNQPLPSPRDKRTYLFSCL
jgi:hypothetical protein